MHCHSQQLISRDLNYMLVMLVIPCQYRTVFYYTVLVYCQYFLVDHMHDNHEFDQCVFSTVSYQIELDT
jgi:hypothetical protein